MGSCMIVVTFLLYLYNPSEGTEEQYMVATNESNRKPCQPNELLPVPTDCRSYYLCMNSVEGPDVLQVKCPDGAMFNSTLRHCLPENDTVPCQARDMSAPLQILPRSSPDECSTPGALSCTDCTSSQICQPNGYARKVLQLINCPEGTYCQKRTGTCEIRVPDCDYLTFQCGQSGTFPDPKNCIKYHVCDKDFKDTSQVCPDGKAYNPASFRCESDINTTACLGDTAPCTDTVSPMLSVNGNCMLYYKCEGSRRNQSLTVPTYYNCPAGKAFVKDGCKSLSDVSDQACLKQLADSGQVCFQSGINTRPGNKCPIKYYFCEKDGDGFKVSLEHTCPDNQVFDIRQTECTANIYETGNCSQLCVGDYPMNVDVDDDCASYFHCQKNQSPKMKIAKCPLGTYFNSDTLSCDSPKNVPYCSGKESGTLLKSIPVIKSRSPKDHPTESPYTSSNSTSPKPPKPFLCNKSGVFPHPDNCRSFIMCRGKMGRYREIKRKCAPGFKFNASSKVCIRGSC